MSLPGCLFVCHLILLLVCFLFKLKTIAFPEMHSFGLDCLHKGSTCQKFKK